MTKRITVTLTIDQAKALESLCIRHMFDNNIRSYMTMTKAQQKENAFLERIVKLLKVE